MSVEGHLRMTLSKPYDRCGVRSCRRFAAPEQNAGPEIDIPSPLTGL